MSPWLLLFGLTILSGLAWVSIIPYAESDHFWYLLLIVNSIASVYLLGWHIGYKGVDDQHFGKLNPSLFRRVYAPFLTLCLFAALVVITASENEIANYSLSSIVIYLKEEILLSVFMGAWFAYLISTYSFCSE